MPPIPMGASVGPPLLSVRDLKTYFPQDEGTVKAVDGVTFDLLPGGTLGIVGESGCGKSVTARSILGIVDRPGRIVEGEIRFRRRAVAGRPEADRVVAQHRKWHNPGPIDHDHDATPHDHPIAMPGQQT